MAVQAPKVLRDEFAMAALTGLLSFGINLWPLTDRNVRKQARLAYEYADAMIVARIQTIELNAPMTLQVEIDPDE